MNAKEVLLKLRADFPQLDPAHDEYDTGIDGAELINWLAEHEDEISIALEVPDV